MKKLVLVAFGGDSTEHDISVITGLQALKNMDGTHYRACPLYLKDGAFYTGDAARSLEFYKNSNLKKLKKAYFVGKTLYTKAQLVHKKMGDVYCVLNCFHGGAGEGGGAQGLFWTQGIPDTSPGLFESALFMDKCFTKYALEHMGIQALDHITLEREAYLAGQHTVQELIDTLGFPMMIKPARLGSSIGISVAKDTQSLIDAINTAFMFDGKLLAEPALTDFYELNIALYRAPEGIVLSDIERPVRREQILDFNEKYLSGKTRGLEGLTREIPANISEELQKKVEQTARILYESLSMKGVIRIDFLADGKTDKIYLNEVNTVPGSLSTYLFRGKKKTARRLTTDLVEVAVKESTAQNAYIKSFPSTVFSNIGFSIKK